MTFSFLDIILFLGVSQGIFLAISLRLIRDRNRAANGALAGLIILAVIMLLGRVLAFRWTGEWVSKIAILVDSTIFLFGPVIYSYVRRLLFLESPTFKLKWQHYILVSIHVVYAMMYWLLPQETLADYYNRGIILLSGFIVETLGILSFGYYIASSCLLLKKHRHSLEKELSYNLKVRQYLKWLLGSFVLSAFLWLFSYINGSFLRWEISTFTYTTMWVSIPLFIYIIGYFSLRQPEVFRVVLIAKPKKEKARLKPEDIQRLQKRLHYYIQEEQIYLIPELTLKSLSSKIDSTPNDLSWLLNQVYQKSFYEYINTLRVEEVIKQLNLGMHQKHTLLAIALDAGFNAKSTFNKAFKGHTGETPSQYIKKAKVA